MKKILIDSGPLIALFDASDKYHDNAIKFIKSNQLPLITTIASITETLHLLDFNRNAQIDFLEWIKNGAVEIHNIEISDFDRIKQLTEKYLDLPMDFADSCLVQEGESFRTTQKSKKSDFFKKSDFSVVWIFPPSCTSAFSRKA